MFTAQQINVVEQALVRKDSTVRVRVLTPMDVPAIVRIAWRFEFFREDVTVEALTSDDPGQVGYNIQFRFGPDLEGPWLNSGLIPFGDLGIHFNQPLTSAIRDVLEKVEARMNSIRETHRAGNERALPPRKKLRR